jgi:hypothetical protein
VLTSQQESTSLSERGHAQLETRLQWQPRVRCGALGLDARPDDSVVFLTCPHCRHSEERRRLLRSRLDGRARPIDPEAPADFLEQTCVFNGWLRERLPYVDTSTLRPEDTAAQVAAWVRSHL